MVLLKGMLTPLIPPKYFAPCASTAATPWGFKGSVFFQITLLPTLIYTVVLGIIVISRENVIVVDGCRVGVAVGVTGGTGGMRTESMTWITPLLVVMSEAITFAPFTMRVPFTVLKVILAPSMVLA